MLKKYFKILPLLVFSSVASAEIRPYVNTDFGFADTDYDSGFNFDIGGGIQFNDNIEFEIAYNHFGDVGPFETEITSFSYGFNVGGKISETTKIFAILGAERLEIDDTAKFGPYSVEIDESSTEAYFGVGAAFKQDDNLEIRTRFISHDSGDIITVNVGLAYYF